MVKKQVWTLITCGLTLAFGPQRLLAAPISGAISFSGNVSAYATTDGTGPASFDLTQAQSLVFASDSTHVSANANGSFAGLAPGTQVAMLTNVLRINPPVLPGVPVWAVGPIIPKTFLPLPYRLLTLSEPVVNSFYGFTVMQLQGVGVVSDGNKGDAALANWVATFSSSGGGIVWNCTCTTLPPPALHVAVVGSNAVISWPTNSAGVSFSLQTATSIPPTNWLAVTNLPTLVSNQMVVTDPIAGSAHLYRLIF